MVIGVGLLHPARILRSGFHLDPAQLVYLDRAFDLALGSNPNIVDPTEPPPGAILEPCLADLPAWAAGIDSQGIVVDVEDIGVLLGVGLTRICDHVHLWVPFRCRADLYWDECEIRQVVEWLDGLLGNPAIPKWFHNIMADVPWLRRIGFRVEGFGGDTMLMHHVAWPELPKGLQALATLYLGAPNWKWMMAEVEEEK